MIATETKYKQQHLLSFAYTECAVVLMLASQH